MHQSQVKNTTHVAKCHPLAASLQLIPSADQDPSNYEPSPEETIPQDLAGGLISKHDRAKKREENKGNPPNVRGSPAEPCGSDTQVVGTIKSVSLLRTEGKALMVRGENYRT